ncbi:hypothetical protein PTSG_04853 [Salpingoeca rosetta]|uniref:Uncharacterized protein n=1 Tax=Salpingoeca rosetta (strain ATCC 50818 / BSB-021) TaxID=946362 RepID=F2U9W3_SALR5|nr:uncharacterized protein PTSG_04853 [Salpingoeca rosetta]EGD73140.1 hypothetical protein PTSG_04853 [Salpingoeca rosetta]|eukprot:XP_004994171.1 hypothetical protein PTSG_04853 [Salpingoeca rosetta]
MSNVTYTPDEVRNWDNEDLVGYLKFLNIGDPVITAFHDSDISGSDFLNIDEQAIADMNVPADDATKIRQGISAIQANEGKTQEQEDWRSDSDDEETPAPAQQQPAAPAVKPTASVKKTSVKVAKKNDPLRLAARSKAVADLAGCAVAAGWLWKVGGSGFKLRSWKRRYFVLTDDNCLYYFKSPKEMSALGMILLPSYTITKADKSENPGNRQFAFKAFNREHEEARKYIFSAETESDMKKWMNVMSLASIAFGSAKASMKKADAKPGVLTDDNDEDLKLMQRRAAERAGGVTGDASEAPSSAPARTSVKLPAYIRRTRSKAANPKGPVLTVVKLLDEQTLQLYAEPSTTGQNILDQVCTMLKVCEKYYFGLEYYDSKGEAEWVTLDKKLLKQDIPRTQDFIELRFCIRFYPVDVTQVLQYVTLYQTFLAARRSVVRNELEISNKDAFMLASLSMQAIHGDYDATKHTPAVVGKEELIPDANKDDIIRSSNIKTADLNTFWGEEVIRVWRSLRGILRHLAVLKYMQIVQKHSQFAMKRFDIKNKNGTPLVLGVHPRGLYCFRLTNLYKPVVSFSWAECSELAYTDKKFSIQVHDKSIKAFSVYTARSSTCQRILDLCVGLHRLYVQAAQQWKNPPPDLKRMRADAVKAALQEREQLKKEALAAKEKAKQLKKEKAAKEEAAKKQAAAESATQQQPEQQQQQQQQAEEQGGEDAPQQEEVVTDEGETVYVKGRAEAVAMLDMMMADADFMDFQESMLADFEDEMVEELEQGGRLRSQSFAGGKRPVRRSKVSTAPGVPEEGEGDDDAEEEDVEVCDNDALDERVQYLDHIHTM